MHPVVGPSHASPGSRTLFPQRVHIPFIISFPAASSHLQAPFIPFSNPFMHLQFVLQFSGRGDPPSASQSSDASTLLFPQREHV